VNHKSFKILLVCLKRYRWLPYLLIGITYALVIFYYMTPQVAHPSTTVYGFGDNTAGPIWRYGVSPDSPFWGTEHITNFPFGDNLSSPVNYSGTIQYVYYWLLANVVGPILAYNLLNATGLLLTAMIMYGFALTLTRRRWIAWLAGYAVTFSPYYQVKIGGHPTYAFQAIFIGMIWLFLRLLQHQRRRDAVSLGSLLALSFYFDPYFVLLTGVVIASFLMVWLCRNRLIFNAQFWRTAPKMHKVKHQLRLLAVTGLTVSILIIPIATVLFTQGSKINSDVASARGNVLAEARACSNWPHEYLVPFVLNPILENSLGKTRYDSTVNFLKGNFTCGIGEDSVGLSITLITIVSVTGVILVWEIINRRKTGLQRLAGFDLRILVPGVLLMMILAVILGFPPLKFHGIPTPSYELLSLTSTWRTLTRVYVLVNVGLIIISAISMSYFANKFKRNKYVLAGLFLVIFFSIGIEYQAFRPFQGNTLANFNYSQDIPTAYTWLKSQADIKVVAEYPIEREGGESDAGSYYLTMQSAHGKKLFNSALSNSPQERYKSGLKDLTDPQTLPVLRAFGVDAVVVHGVPAADLEKLPGVVVLKTAPQSRFNLLSHTPIIKNDNIVIISIRNVPAASYFVTLGSDFARNTTIIRSAADWEYEAQQNSGLLLNRITNKKVTMSVSSQSVCFMAKMSLPADADTLDIIVDGKLQSSSDIASSYKGYQVQAAHSIVLHNHLGHNMRVAGIGCLK
jgi:hypothetical protein